MTHPPADPAAGRALFLSSLGFFLITLDILIVNVALTDIGRELGGGTVGLQWVVDGYTLPFAALLLFAGTFADRIGAKQSLIIGTAAFLAASVACAIAPVLAVLIVARVIQGAAAALMLPATMSLIREAYPDAARRARALGIWAVGGAIAAAVGPLIGGVLTTLDWRLVFAINVPVTVAMLVLMRRIAHSPRRRVRFDWRGQLAAAIGLTALVYCIITGGDHGFAQPAVVAAGVLAVIAFVVFIRVQATGEHPMLPLSLFRASGMRIALAVGFTFMVGWYGTVFVVSLFLQQQLGLAPLLAGLAFLPSAAFSALGNLISGRLTNRFGARVPTVAGQLLMVVALVALAATAPLGDPLLTACLIVPMGLGTAVAGPATSAVVLDSVPAERAGVASAVYNTFRQIGGAVAIAVFGTLIARPSTFISGLETSFIIAACLLVATAVLSLRFPSASPTGRPAV